MQAIRVPGDGGQAGGRRGPRHHRRATRHASRSNCMVTRIKATLEFETYINTTFVTFVKYT